MTSIQPQPELNQQILEQELKILQNLERKLAPLEGNPVGKFFGRIIRQLEAGLEKFVRAIFQEGRITTQNFQKRLITRQKYVVNTLNKDLNSFRDSYKEFLAKDFKNLEAEQLENYHEINVQLQTNLQLMILICGHVRRNAPDKIAPEDVDGIDQNIQNLFDDIEKFEKAIHQTLPEEDIDIGDEDDVEDKNQLRALLQVQEEQKVSQKVTVEEQTVADKDFDDLLGQIDEQLAEIEQPATKKDEIVNQAKEDVGIILGDQEKKAPAEVELEKNKPTEPEKPVEKELPKTKKKGFFGRLFGGGKKPKEAKAKKNRRIIAEAHLTPVEPSTVPPKKLPPPPPSSPSLITEPKPLPSRPKNLKTDVAKPPPPAAKKSGAPTKKVIPPPPSTPPPAKQSGTPTKKIPLTPSTHRPTQSTATAPQSTATKATKPTAPQFITAKATKPSSPSSPPPTTKQSAAQAKKPKPTGLSSHRVPQSAAAPQSMTAANPPPPSTPPPTTKQLSAAPALSHPGKSRSSPHLPKEGVKPSTRPPTRKARSAPKKTN